MNDLYMYSLQLYDVIININWFVISHVVYAWKIIIVLFFVLYCMQIQLLV